MPIYLINFAEEDGKGPFADREGAAEAYDDSGDTVVVEIDEAGQVTFVKDAADYFEDDED